MGHRSVIKGEVIWEVIFRRRMFEPVLGELFIEILWRFAFGFVPCWSFPSVLYPTDVHSLIYALPD